MVVVRESPRAHLSPPKNPAHWPPRSPFQALLSSPSGKKRWEDSQTCVRPTSPSPTSIRSRALQDELNTYEEDEAEDQDEDEETLQLKLAEIQAKLKLKRLQTVKKSGGSSEPGRTCRDNSARSSSPSKPQRRPISPAELYRAAVEVPLSPVRNARAAQEQLSPARQRLGLTSVPRAQDVSLKRARDGRRLNRQQDQTLSRSAEALPAKKSFSERLAESKSDTIEKQAKKDRLEHIRSNAFTHSRGERTTAAYSSTDSTATQDHRISSTQASTFTEPRASSNLKVNTGAYGQDSGTGHAEIDDDSSIHFQDADEATAYDPFSKIHLSKRHISHAIVAREMEGKEVYSLPRLLKEVKSPEYEPPDCESDYVVFAVLASKSNPLDHAQTHLTAEKGKDDFEAPRNKFMVLHLCDLKWEIDVFLFGTAFNQFWKLTPGTLLAILNPAILPPKGSQHSGRFSLKLGSSEDAVMEIGVARDLSYCSAVKKDGQHCGDWIDKRKAEACEFHISLQVVRSRKTRMEVNTMFRGASDAERQRRRSRPVKDGQQPRKPAGREYHHEYGQIYSVSAGIGKGMASLLDAEDTDALHNMTQEEASRKRIANAQKERDLAKQLSEMGRGPGAEYLRTKHTSTTTTTSSNNASSRTINNNDTGDAAESARNALFSKPSAADLGLLGKKATDARLSPAKDRRRHFGLGKLSKASTTSSSAPMGWSGARKAGLLQPKESRLGSPERGQTTLPSGERQSRDTLVRPRSQMSSMRSNGSSSPVKKKARFVLESKGIREPGRESLPGDKSAATVATGNDDDDDDDDDLDIIL